MLQEEKYIWFVVKKASENGMSDYLTNKISLDEQIILKWPIGHYTNPKKHTSYLLVSIGSGLSPNFWIFQHLVYESRDYQHIVNILWERTIQELVPFIQDRFTLHEKNNISNFFCLSQEKSKNSEYIYGYVQTKLADALALLGTKTTCFVCGSPAIVTDVVYQLTQLGVAREDIVVEKY